MRDDASLGFLLRKIRDGLLARTQGQLAANGITINFSQFLVIKLLAKNGPQMPGELARCLDHNAGAMTRLIDRLVGYGYVRRKPHPLDRRAQTVELTAKGQKLWNTINRHIEESQALALRGLSAKQRTVLFDLLRTVRDALDSPSE